MSKAPPNFFLLKLFSIVKTLQNFPALYLSIQSTLDSQKDRLFCNAIVLILFKNNQTYCWMGKLSGKPVTPLWPNCKELHAFTLQESLTHSLASTALKRDSSKGGREGRTVWGGGALGTGSSWLWVSFEHLFDRRFVVAVKLKVEKQMKVLTFNERSNFDFSTCYDY